MNSTTQAGEPEKTGPLFRIRKEELRAVFSAALWFFLLMSSYQILRPIRETLAAEQNSAVKQLLFFGTFLAALGGTLGYSWLAGRIPRIWLVRVVTHTSAAIIALFGWLLMAADPAQSIWLSRFYFVWVTVFSLFITSTFWSVMADLFSQEQGRRLFGPIAAGATLGAIAGSTIAKWLATELGLSGLVFLSAGLLEAGGVVASFLLGGRQLQNSRATAPVDGGIFEGLTALLRSRYLLWIAVYLALMSLCGTTIYLQLTETAGLAIEDRKARTGFFAGLNLYTQIGSLIAQSLLVSPLIRWIGLGSTLALLPGMYVCSFAVLSSQPGLAWLTIIDVATRSTTYGITVPAREVLFTVVSREEKYKAKNFIDTVVFRGADSVASNLFAAARGLLGQMANLWLFVPVAVGWIGVAHLLGRQQKRLAEPAPAELSPPTTL